MSIEQSKERENTKEVSEQKEKFESPFFEIVNEKGETKKFCKGPFFSVDSNEIGKICESLVFDKSEFLINMRNLFDKTLSDSVSDREKQKILRNFENKIIEFQIDLKDKIQRAIVDGITNETALRDTNTLSLIISAASLELKNILGNTVENKGEKSKKEQEDEINIALLTVKAKTIKSIENYIFKDFPEGLKIKLFRSEEERKFFGESTNQNNKELSTRVGMYDFKNLPEGIRKINEETEGNIKKAKEKEPNPLFEIKDKKTNQTAKICKGPFFDKEFRFLNSAADIFGEKEDWRKLIREQDKKKIQKYLEDLGADIEKLSFSLKERMDRTALDGIKDETALKNTYKLNILAMMAVSELKDVFWEVAFGENKKQDDKEVNGGERTEKKMEDSILRIRRKFIRSVERIIIKSEDSEFSGTEELEFPDLKEYKWLKMLVGKETEETRLKDDYEKGRGKEYSIPADVFYICKNEKERECLERKLAEILFRKKEKKVEVVEDLKSGERTEKENTAPRTEEKDQEQILEAEFSDMPGENKIEEEIPEEEETLTPIIAKSFCSIKYVNQQLGAFKETIDKIIVRVFSEKDTTEMLRDYKTSLNNLRDDVLIFNLSFEEEIERARKEYKKKHDRFGRKTFDEEAIETTRSLVRSFSNWIENMRVAVLRYVIKDSDMDVENITEKYLEEKRKLRQFIGQSILTVESKIGPENLAIKNIEEDNGKKKADESTKEDNTKKTANKLYERDLDPFVFNDSTEKMAEKIKLKVAEMLEKYKDLRRSEAYHQACEEIKESIGGKYTDENIGSREMLREKRKLKEEIAKRSIKGWEKECEEKLKRIPPKKAETKANVGFTSDLGEIQPKEEGLEKATDEERINALHRLAIEIYLKRLTFTARRYINAIETIYKLIGRLDPDSKNRKMFKLIEKDIKDVQPPNKEIKDLHENFIMRLEELLKEITSETERKAKKNVAEAEQKESTEEKLEEEIVKKEWYEVDAGKYKDFADKLKSISGELQKTLSYVSETESGKIDWKEEKAAMENETEMKIKETEEKLKEIWPSEEKIDEHYENLTKNLKETVKNISQAKEKERVDLYLQSVDEANDIEKKLKPISGYVGLVDYLDSLKHLENIEDLNLEINRNSAGIVESEIRINENSTILEEMERKLKEKQKKERALSGEINESSKDMIEFKDETGEIKKKIEEAKRKIEEAKSKMEKARIEIKNGKEGVEKIREKAKKKAEKMNGEIEKMIGKSEKEIRKFKPDKNKLEKYLKNISGSITIIDEELSKAGAKDKNRFSVYLETLDGARKRADKIYNYLSSFDSRNIEEAAKEEMKKMITNQIEKAISEAEEKLEKIITTN